MMMRRKAVLGALMLALSATCYGPVYADSAKAADLIAPQASKAVPVTLTSKEYLDKYAQLILLRLRFNAVVQTEVADQMLAAARSYGLEATRGKDLIELRTNLRAETTYYAINLKYLIMADGAIWPQDKSKDVYRQMALSQIQAVLDQLDGADVLYADTGAILQRLENINAWTEGVVTPPQDWFSADKRDQMVSATLDAVHADA